MVTAAKDFKITTLKSDSLFQVLFKVIQAHLKLSDTDVMDILAQRLEKKQDEVSEAVLEVDEAAEVLEQEDRKLITQSKDKLKEENSRAATFGEEYAHKRREVRLFELEKAKSGPPAKRQKASAPRLPSLISQSTAQEFLPPCKCSIWKGHTRLDWNGHRPPFSRVHAPHSLYGEEGAMLRVLAMLWLQHCKVLAIDVGPDVCPFCDKLVEAAKDVDIGEIT